jgi:hypothetical protein
MLIHNILNHYNDREESNKIFLNDTAPEISRLAFVNYIPVS